MGERRRAAKPLNRHRAGDSSEEQQREAEARFGKLPVEAGEIQRADELGER
jgi:hypothetical protein